MIAQKVYKLIDSKSKIRRQLLLVLLVGILVLALKIVVNLWSCMMIIAGAGFTFIALLMVIIFFVSTDQKVPELPVI